MDISGDIPKALHLVTDGHGNLNHAAQGWVLSWVLGVTMVVYEDRTDVFSDIRCDSLIFSRQGKPDVTVYAELQDCFSWIDEQAERWEDIADYILPTPIIVSKYSNYKLMADAARSNNEPDENTG